jgi:hypothetical protein
MQLEKNVALGGAVLVSRIHSFPLLGQIVHERHASCRPCRAKLDDRAQALRHVMPAAWDVDSGCVYARLHAKQIDFTPPAKFACDCRAAAIV